MPTASTTIEEPKKHQAPIHWPVLQRIDSLRVVDLRVHQAHTWFGKDWKGHGRARSRSRQGLTTAPCGGNFTLPQGQRVTAVHLQTNSIEWLMPDDKPGDLPPTPKPKVPRPDGGGAVLAERKAARTKPPSLYQVVMLNDDYTPMEFVVMVLQEFFQRDTDTAMLIMLKIHHEGRGVCGVYLQGRGRNQGRTGAHRRTARRASAAVHYGGRMIAQELEVSLHMAFVEARQQRHEFITVEHLLMALLDNPSAAEVLRACAANIEDLRKSLATFIKENTPTVGGTEEVDTQPTLGFQRVIQRAIMHVQSTGSGKKEVTGANVLVAIFGEKDSHAVYYLHQQGVTRLDVVNFIAHGIKKSDPPEPAKSNPSNRQRRREGRRPAARWQGLAAGAVHPEPEPAGQRRQDRPADRARARGRARHPGAVPPPQEQPAAGGRGRRGQDGHRRRPGLAHHRGRRARGAGRTPPSMRSTWARCWPAPSTAATSSSA
jgi:ATP-dependent Clp protease adapter protein ClpS